MEKVKVTFLGTGPSGRIPRPGCSRPSCRDARKKGSRSRRSQQSLLLEYEDTMLLFDASEDILEQWHHARHVRRLDGVFISHPHSDAFGGMAKLKVVMRRLEQEHLPVYAEKETWDRAHERFTSLEFLEQRILHTGRRISAGTIGIKPFRVEHTFKRSHPTAGFAIACGHRRIVLITDVKKVPAASYRTIGRPDLLIMDCAIYENDFPSHVNLAQALELIGKIGPRRTMLTQIGVTWPPYDEARRIARRHGVDISHDGLTIQV